jgi:hypothetical protein
VGNVSTEIAAADAEIEGDPAFAEDGDIFERKSLDMIMLADELTVISREVKGKALTCVVHHGRRLSKCPICALTFVRLNAPRLAAAGFDV